MESKSKEVGKILISFYKDMKKLEDSQSHGKRSTLVVMTINDIEKLFSDLK